MILADKIVNLRKRSGWSQEELAEKMGVSRQSISKWEGAQSVPDMNRILKLSEVFHVSTDYLLRDDMEELQCSVIPATDTEQIEDDNGQHREHDAGHHGAHFHTAVASPEILNEHRDRAVFFDIQNQRGQKIVIPHPHGLKNGH